MSARGSSESMLHNLTLPSMAHEARQASEASTSSVARGLNTTLPTLAWCPRMTRSSLQSGTDQSLQRPDQDPVTSIFESGLKLHQEMGLVSAIWDASTSRDFSFRWISCFLAILVASVNAASSFMWLMRFLALGMEKAAIHSLKKIPIKWRSEDGTRLLFKCSKVGWLSNGLLLQWWPE